MATATSLSRPFAGVRVLVGGVVHLHFLLAPRLIYLCGLNLARDGEELDLSSLLAHYNRLGLLLQEVNSLAFLLGDVGHLVELFHHIVRNEYGFVLDGFTMSCMPGFVGVFDEGGKVITHARHHDVKEVLPGWEPSLG